MIGHKSDWRFFELSIGENLAHNSHTESPSASSFRVADNPPVNVPGKHDVRILALGEYNYTHIFSHG